MTQSKANGDGEKRRRWSAKDKADLLMRHFKKGESSADLSDATGVSPTLLSQWGKTLFEGAATIFETRRGGKATA